MARFVRFTFLVLALHFTATEQLQSQENATAPLGSDLNLPVIGGTETATDGEISGVEREYKPVDDSATVALKLKKPKSFYDEMFSNPLNYGLILIVGFYIYLMFLQPRAGRREQKVQLERLKSLKKNDRVITTSGIHGIVANINVETGTIVLRVDENSNAKLTIDRTAIRTVSN